MSDSATPWITAHQASLSFTTSWNLFRLKFIESVMSSNHLVLCHPLLLLSSVFPSIRVFSSESALCIRWPEYRSFSFSISPSREYSGLISFRIDWFDFLAIHGTLKSLLQSHSWTVSVLRLSVFFMVQLSHPILIQHKSSPPSSLEPNHKRPHWSFPKHPSPSLLWSSVMLGLLLLNQQALSETPAPSVRHLQSIH